MSESIDLDLRSDEIAAFSSSSLVRKADVPVKTNAQPETGLTGIDAKLASVELPRLEREDRARLQMQNPTRLYFYWSLKNDPFQVVNKAVIGGVSGYQLVLKLINLTRESEQIEPAEASGSWWFDVDSDCEYRAEIGLFATNRPYVRILFSNTIRTPRRRPSPRVATEADWMVSSETFANVLSVSGFKQDAFEVALIDERPAIVRTVLSDLIGNDVSDVSESDGLISALLHLSLGLPMESLKWRIDASLFQLLQHHLADLSAERARVLLKERFGVEHEELAVEELHPTTVGGSMVNFPRVLRRRVVRGDYRPLSSFKF